MRATLVLLGMLISGSATADIVIGLDSALGAGNGCRIEVVGGNDHHPLVAIEARCGNGTKWESPIWPPETADAAITWSRENRVLERVLAGERVTIPDEHQRR